MKKNEQVKNFSLEHKRYLKRLRNDKIFVLSCQILILVVFFALWELFALPDKERMGYRFKTISTFMYYSHPLIIYVLRYLVERTGIKISNTLGFCIVIAITLLVGMILVSYRDKKISTILCN